MFFPEPLLALLVTDYYLRTPPPRFEKLLIFSNFFRFSDSLELAEYFLYQKFFRWGSNFLKIFQLKISIFCTQLSILFFISFFSRFFGVGNCFGVSYCGLLRDHRRGFRVY